ncbi:putative serine/threonine-protein kinase iks1 [Myotisia sp. PD_48]|nr:putative serine/threonine-protein kinase iks1 [Myotisia sp. PD_48]
MADSSRSMSIVPYGAAGDIVLRHDDAVVVYDHESRQLTLRNANRDVDVDVELAECPYCHRSMHEGTPENGRERGRRSTPAVQPEFVNPDYFRMLDASLPASPERSVPPATRRQIVPIEQESASASASDLEDAHIPSPGISSAAFSHNYFKRFFVEERELGRGGKGVVFLVKHVLDGVSLGHFACKRVPVGDDHDWLKKVLIEVQLLQRLSHQNLVSYRHVWLENAKLSKFGPNVPCAFILQQYCNAGDLQKYVCGPSPVATTPQQLKDRLRRRSRGQPEPPSDSPGPRKLALEQIYSFFKDITSGLHFLHEHSYIHRDLKPNNCLLHDTGHELRVLVSDFGEVQSENTVRTSTGTTGTISFCAPEVLRRISPNGPFGNFTFKSDIFSLGMILYFLCFGKLPYSSSDVIDEDKEDLDQLRVEIGRWAGFDDARRMRSDLPDKLYSFLTRLLAVDPDRRPTADEVLKGIQTGGGPNEPRRFHRNGSPSRVLPVDVRTPDSSSSGSHGHPTGGAAGLGLSQVPILRPTNYDRANSTRSPEENGSMKTPIDHFLDNTSEHQDLVLRQTPPSPRAIRGQHDDQNRHLYNSSQLLLPPPRRIPFVGGLFNRRVRTFVPQLTRFWLFIVKILSLTQLCMPLAVTPWVLYPLLMLAALDLNIHDTKFHVGSLLLHFVVVIVALRTNILCFRRPHDTDGIGP